MAKRKNADSEEEDEEEFVDQLEDDSAEDEELVQPPKTTKPPLPGRNTAQVCCETSQTITSLIDASFPRKTRSHRTVAVRMRSL